MAQTEVYVEYSQTGRVIKGPEPAKARSKYEEDVHPLNHTSVWGSYWVDGKWGYACCHLTSRNAYCTGEAGKQAMQASMRMLEDNMNAAEEIENKTLVEEHMDNLKKRKDPAEASNPKRSRLGEGDVQLDSSKLKSALEEEKERIKRGARGDAKYNALQESEMSEEQLEAYRMLRTRGEDPMANYVDDGEQ